MAPPTVAMASLESPARNERRTQQPPQVHGSAGRQRATELEQLGARHTSFRSHTTSSEPTRLPKKLKNHTLRSCGRLHLPSKSAAAMYAKFVVTREAACTHALRQCACQGGVRPGACNLMYDCHACSVVCYSGPICAAHRGHRVFMVLLSRKGPCWARLQWRRCTAVHIGAESEAVTRLQRVHGCSAPVVAEQAASCTAGQSEADQHVQASLNLGKAVNPARHLRLRTDCDGWDVPPQMMISPSPKGRPNKPNLAAQQRQPLRSGSIDLHASTAAGRT